MTFPIAFTEKMKIGNTHVNNTDYSMTTEQKLKYLCILKFTVENIVLIQNVDQSSKNYTTCQMPKSVGFFLVSHCHPIPWHKQNSSTPPNRHN